MTGPARGRERPAVTPGPSAIAAEAARHPVLGRDEEADLLRRAGAGDREATRRLVGSHLRFVIRIARSYRGFGLPMNDLIQEGIVGLVQAVRRFDPSRGARLSTYAMYSIRAAIQESVLRSWSMVRSGTGNAHKLMVLQLRRIGGDLGGGAGESGEDVAGALAARFGATKADVLSLARRISGDHSLDQSDDDGATLLDRLASDAPDPEQWMERRSRQRRVVENLTAALGRLPRPEQTVIRRRYLEEAKATFATIGRELGVSKDRARQLEAKALGRLKRLLDPQASDLV